MMRRKERREPRLEPRERREHNQVSRTMRSNASRTMCLQAIEIKIG